MRILIAITLLFNIQLYAKVLNVGKDKEYKDLNTALKSCSEGDTIFIYPGTYELESNDGTSFIALKSNLTIKGSDRHKVIIKPKGESPSYEALFRIVDLENVSIEDLTLDSPHGNVFVKNSDNITVRNCIFKGFRWNARKKMALYVEAGGTFNSSSKLIFEHILFNNTNPVYLGTGNSGQFIDNCLYNVENSNYWHLSNSSSWSYKDIYVHKTILKKSHQNVDRIHNLADAQTWIHKRDGLSWGAIKELWVPLNPRVEEKKESSDSFFDSLENVASEDAIDINIEIKEEAFIDKTGPEIYLEERQKFRDVKIGSPNDIIRGKVIDISGVKSLTIIEKSAHISNGTTETLHTHEVKINNGEFEQELELDEDDNLIFITAVDTKGNQSHSSFNC